MVRDLMESVSAYLRDRIANPLGGALLIAFLAWNHPAIFVLFSSEPIKWRLAYIDYVLYPSPIDKVIHLVVIPAILALIYLFAYPWVARPVYRYVLKARLALQDIKMKAEGAQLLTEEQGERIRRSSYEREKRLKGEISELRGQVEIAEQSVQEAREHSERLRGRILQLEEELVMQKSEMDRVAADIAGKAEVKARLELAAITVQESVIKSKLLSSDFILTFNPKNGMNKRITFIDGGEVGLGRNQNEYRWRIKDAALEFLDKAGELFSRFRYDSQTGGFAMESFEGQSAIHGQKLMPVEG